MEARMNIRNKGRAGEIEFCKWLTKTLGLTEEPKRNLNQTREGGADVIYPPFIFEVKRVRRLAFKSWWDQITVARRGHKIQTGECLFPVVAFRPDNCQWEFLIHASELDPRIQAGYLHINRFVFRSWARTKFLAQDT
jgi:hypothetical protein